MKTLFFALVSCWLAATLAANPAFDRWAEDFTQEWLRAHPPAATSLQYLPDAAQQAADRELTLTWSDGTPVRAAERAEHVALARRGLDELAQFPAADLTAVQRVSATFLKSQLESKIRTAQFADQRYVFDQFRGVHFGLVLFLTQTHPLRSRQDLENYLARLGQAGSLLELARLAAEERAERGIVPPRFILDATLAGIDRFLEPPPERNALVDTLAQAAARREELPPAEREALVARAHALVEADIRPAFRRIRDTLARHREAATSDAGIWRLPRGDEMYAEALRTFTTTNLTAEEIHTIGLREVARIEAEMDPLLRQLGYTEGSVQSRYQLLQASCLPPATPDPRPAMMEEITAIVRDAERRAAALFDLRPRAPVEVRREPRFSEAGAAARYTAPAPDGSRPGIYWIPLARITPDVIWLGAGTRSVAYHEAVPGHHFQITIQQESTELPRFRQRNAYGFISAFGEGWALYAERIADEAGWYEGDPIGRLGYLSFQLFRARRLVVDTGLHAMRWTREQAIEYGIQASEVERYVVWPGQACSYMIGQLRILALREKARTALGETFSLKAFHDVVLRTGMVPLDVLSEVIDQWIAETSRGG